MMSQNPYATPFPQQQYGMGYPPGYGMAAPARTSSLAVVSLILSLLCCTAPLGVVFGGLALLGIGLSGGKVKGVGIAIAGLIIGIIFTALWIGIIVGGMQMFSLFGSMVEPVVKGLEQRDTPAVQAGLVSTAQGSVDAARVEEFGRLMEETYGSYERMPDGASEMFNEFIALISNTSVGPAIQAAQNQYGQDGTFPMPVKFDSGWRAVMISMDSSGRPGPSGVPLLRDIGIILDDGTLVWLVYDAGRAVPTGGGPGAGGRGTVDEDPDDLPADEPAATGTTGTGGRSEPARPARPAREPKG